MKNQETKEKSWGQTYVQIVKFTSYYSFSDTFISHMKENPYQLFIRLLLLSVSDTGK